jgi:hypothetical protein
MPGQQKIQITTYLGFLLVDADVREVESPPEGKSLLHPLSTS